MFLNKVMPSKGHGIKEQVYKYMLNYFKPDKFGCIVKILLQIKNCITVGITKFL